MLIFLIPTTHCKVDRLYLLSPKIINYMMASTTIFIFTTACSMIPCILIVGPELLKS